MPDWNPQANKIFLDALEIAEAEDRRAFIENASEGDADLLAHVNSLIDASQKAGRFLETSPLHVRSDPNRTVDASPGEHVGRQIGPYRLLEQIGEGGMGTVFRAEQTVPVHRKVALKVIKAGMDTRSTIARFEAERQALTLMDHVNIARVLDGGTTESGQPYFVMELIDGVPITMFCDKNLLTPRERLELFVPVCQAIQHAHQKGIIHRDIKPSNVLVTLYDGRPVPKVIDFGVAKAIEQKLTEKTMFTQHGTMVGTLEYMSPEQAGMSHLGIDTRSDIYSLGVLLYELLTGSTPLSDKCLREAAYAEILGRIQNEEPPRPSARLSDSGEALASISAQRHMEPAKLAKLLRGELDWIVMKCLEKNRNRRYESASGFAMDVQRYLADEPVSACPPSTMYRIGKFARRNKAALATTLVVALALVLTTVGLALSNAHVRAERNEKIAALGQKERALREKQVALGEKGAALTEAKANFAEAKRQEGIAQAQAKLAQRRFYAAQMNLAIKAWEDGHPSRVLQLLESQRPRFDEEDLRGFDWYYLWRLCQGTYRFSLPSFNYDDSASMAISSDGTTLASVDGRTVRLWDVSTGREIGELPGHVEMVNGLAFTPDGTTLAASDGTESVILWDLATRTQRATIKPGQAVSGLQFTADGRTLVLSGKQVKLWDAVANEELARLGESETGFTNVAVAADGSAIVASGSSNFVHIWFQDGGKWREEPSLKATWGFPFLAISPDGKLLAVCSASLLKFYDLPTLEERAAPQGHTGRVFAARFTADGKRVASAGEDRTVRFWDVATGQQLACIAHHGPVYGLELTPDGERFASMCTGMVRVWDVSPPAPASVLPQVGPALSLAVSPDGKVVASRGWQKTNLWDIAEGRLIASLPTEAAPNQWFRTLAFVPDGESLAFTNGNNVDVTTIRGHRVMVLECNAATNCVTYSPDAKALAVATQSGVVEVWDLATQQRRYSTPAGNRAVVVAFSPDGRTMAAGYQFGVVKLFDSADGRELSTLQRFEFAIDWAYALAFSPDSRKLATGNQQGLVRIWDVATNQIDATLIGHTDAVKSLAFLDGGRMLATGSDDRTVRLWDVETGQERISLEGHTDALTGVAFAVDGGVLVTSSRDGTVRLWRSAIDDHARAPKREVDPEGEQSPVADNEAGDRLWNSGRLREAEAAYRRALARLELLLSAYPEEPRYQYEIVRSLLSISLLLKAERGDLAAAEAARKRAMTLYNQLSPQEQQRMLLVWDERARKLHGSGAAPQAERILIQMIELIPEDDPRLLTRAAHHLAACSDPKLRDTVRAVQLTEQAVALSVNDKPAFASALSYLGVALECNGQRAEAAEPYRQANLVWQALSEEEPGNVWYRHEWAFFSLTLARILHEAGDLEGAVEYCRTSVRLNEQLVTEFPNVATHADRLGDGHSFLIHVLSALGRNEEAAAVRHDQESFKKQRAAWHEQQRAAAEAEKPSRQANPQQPTPPPTHLARGWAFLNQKQFPEAESAFRDHLQLQPDHAAGLRGLGKALARQNKIAEANSALRAAIKLDPAEFWAHEHLGWVLLKQQELSAAEASFREAVRLQPALESGYRGLGEALKEQNKFQEALIPLREVIRLNATDHQAHSELGWTLFALGRFAESEREFRESIQLKPDSSTTQFGLGRALSEQKKFAESIAPLQASIKADPSNDYGRDALGWAFISLQKFAEAELEFREVIRLNPNLAKGHFGLGRALVEQGKYSHAEAALREAIRLEPTHPRARQMLGRALAGQGRTANAEALKKEESDQTRSEPAKKKPRE